MHIGVSLLNYRPGKIGGAETYIKKLLQYLIQVSSKNDKISFICHKGNQDHVDCPIQSKVVLNYSDISIVGKRIVESFWGFRPKKIERVISELNLDVIFYPQQSLFPLHNSIPSVLTIGDIQHVMYPEYFSWFDTKFRNGIYSKSLELATSLIAISEFTKGQIHNIYKIDSERIKVIHHGFEAKEISSKPSPVIQDSYIYYPAASFRHKGHLTLINSYSNLKKLGKSLPKIIFTGMQTKYWQEIDKTITSLNLKDCVSHLGFLPYDEIINLYLNADAIVFPTEYEGFGIPVLEANQFKKKIICSKLAVFGEIGVPESCQIDFSKPEQLFEALADKIITPLSIKPMTWKDVILKTYNHLIKTANKS
jgi:glycosyltransferase involved in cell wall biosynthesis